MTVASDARTVRICRPRPARLAASLAENDHDAYVVTGDCLNTVAELPSRSVDLVFGSPPYEDRRTYDIDFDKKGDDWVRWTADRFVECCRVSCGLVCFVVDGKTRNYQYSMAPERLMVELAGRGISIRRPAYYMRWGVPGSGGSDYLKNRLETVVVGQLLSGKLAWADPTACGWEPRLPEGGALSNRARDGRRVSDWTDRSRRRNGSRRSQAYAHPSRANPGNVVDCGAAGGGNMGHNLAHENEAPYPVKLAEFFVRSFCSPDGLVLDPFGGSGTTAHAALLHGRRAISVDVRASQSALTTKRLKSIEIGGDQ